jgi:hypothetical protein
MAKKSNNLQKKHKWPISASQPFKGEIPLLFSLLKT